MEMMMAARYLGPNHLEPVEVPLPAVGPDEALVEVEACGFCGSDLGIVAGTHPRAKAPLTIGHEFCGRVARMSGTGGGIREGDRVTSYPLISCGRCFICREGQPTCAEPYGCTVSMKTAEWRNLSSSRCRICSHYSRRLQHEWER